MGLKVASRVCGLSDTEFHEAFGTEEQPRRAGPVALARRFRLSGLRAFRALLSKVLPTAPGSLPRTPWKIVFSCGTPSSAKVVSRAS